MILTILISAILSVTITFAILYYLGKKKTQEALEAQNDAIDGAKLVDLMRELEQQFGGEIQFEEISEEDYTKLETTKKDKKIILH